MIKTQPIQAQSKEMFQKFIPTPERLSQYLERNQQEILTQLSSVEGREKLYGDLVEHEDDLRKLDPTFNAEELRSQLDLVGVTLQSKQRFLEQAASPEKKGFFRRSWEKVKGFAKRHPIVTVLLALVLVAGGGALGLYLSGNLQSALSGPAMDTLKQFFRGTDKLNPPLGPMPGFNPATGSPLG